jgi:Flp pilus assembly protein TadG
MAQRFTQGEGRSAMLPAIESLMRDRRGATALVFAISAPVLMMAAAAAVDY